MPVLERWLETKANLNKLIDPKMRKLVVWLNEHGYYTEACCQGRTALWQFCYRPPWAHKHCSQAYLTFSQQIPEKIREELTKKGLKIYLENCGIDGGIPLHDSYFLKEKAEGTKDENQGWMASKGVYVERYTLEKKKLLIEHNKKFVDIIFNEYRAFGSSMDS